MLINDCGPEVDAIEANIKKSIKGHDNFQYFRNDENLGFVGTCNRSIDLDSTENDILLLNSDTLVTAGFIEEMSAVLYLTDKHGSVCPRSNNATIASLPFFFRDGDGSKDRTAEYTAKVYKAVKEKLPRFSIVPVTPGFCMLIRRTLIADYGLFDSVYGVGYHEENDFCMRINLYGYSCVMANHALVYHLESKSFTSEKKRIQNEKNQKILSSRYPFFDETVGKYLSFDMDPVDRFADVIYQPKSRQKQIMIDLFHLPLAMNGTARNCISFVDRLSKHSSVISKKIDVTVVATPEASRFHNLASYGFEVLSPHQVNKLYDVAICPLQIFHTDNLLMLNRYALRIVFAHLDIIAIRSRYLLSKSTINEVIFEDAFRLANKVVMISDFTKEDAITYFSPIRDLIERKSVTILQGYPDVNFAIDEKDINHTHDNEISTFISEGDYVLVFGNDFKHKMINETVRELEQTEYRVVVFGSKGSGNKDNNTLYIESGGVSDEIVWNLYKSAASIVFPSVYEGFGLPIAEAANFKVPIIVKDNALNREVAAVYDSYTRIEFYEKTRELPRVLRDLKNHKNNATIPAKSKRGSLRTITNYNDDLIDVCLRELNEPVDGDALRERWGYFSRIDRYMMSVGGSRFAKKSFVERGANYLRSRNQRMYYLSRTIYRSTIKRNR